jgi:hypothetical protein
MCRLVLPYVCLPAPTVLRLWWIVGIGAVEVETVVPIPATVGFMGGTTVQVVALQTQSSNIISLEWYICWYSPEQFPTASNMKISKNSETILLLYIYIPRGERRGPYIYISKSLKLSLIFQKLDFSYSPNAIFLMINRKTECQKLISNIVLKIFKSNKNIVGKATDTIAHLYNMPCSGR